MSMKNKNFVYLSILLFIVSSVVFACSSQKAVLSDTEIEAVGVEAITEDNLRTHIAFLSDDLLEGRFPGERGMFLATRYMAAQFELLGIEPGGDNGTYYQKVTLKKITIPYSAQLKFTGGPRTISLKWGENVILFQDYTGDNELKVSVVFMGYGIESDAAGWNDYKDYDVEGKILIILPGIPEHSDFDDRAPAMLGSRDFKLNLAKQKGAAGLFIAQDTKTNPDLWEGLKKWTMRPQFRLSGEEHKPGPLVASYDISTGSSMLKGFIKDAAVSELLDAGGYSASDVMQQAKQKDFSPVPLKFKTDFVLGTKIEKVECRNAIGLIRGKTEDEYVIVSAHLDALGVDESIEGDGIFNGAVDNATGSAGAIEIGRAFLSLPEKPSRSIVLIGTTSEELGLLGARAYARNPIFPAGKTLAVVNMDEYVDLIKRPEVFIAAGEISTLGDVARAVSKDNGVSPMEIYGPGAEAGLSNLDAGGFVESGIPVVTLIDATKPPVPIDEYMDEMRKNWGTRGHTPHDEYNEDWEFGNILQMIRMTFQITYRITNLEEWPEWVDELPDYYPPSPPYKKIREESLKKGSL